ncbi:adhesion G-protein coupled receptor G5 isoform X2 [Ambystoma mexicanum]|uniref:adhesion G-protein coupled receptor G5 isoform X2 n=1 Tax=Ambystoma mexicanum TaxID=8296 RepID=UPI0037E89C14
MASVNWCRMLFAVPLLLFIRLQYAEGPHPDHSSEMRDIVKQVDLLNDITLGKQEPSEELEPKIQILILENLLGTNPLSSQNISVKMSHVQALVFKINPGTFKGLDITHNSTKHENHHAMSFPAEILRRNKARECRLVCIYFDSSILFQDGKNSSLLNDNIVGATVYGSTVANLSNDVKVHFWHNQSLDESNAKCVFWITGTGNGPGNWSTDGCRTVHQPNHTMCLCNHLTYFAVLLQISTAPLDAWVLASATYITYAGCGISAVAALLTILMFIFCRKRKNDCTTKIHMNLVAAILLLNLCFLTNEALASHGHPGLCMATATLLHCSLLCCFTWMAIEGFHLYLLLIKVYNIYVRHYLCKLSAVGWGLPILTVILIALIRGDSYGTHTIGTYEGYQNRTMCWVVSWEVNYGLNLAYVGFIFVFNASILIIATKKIRNLHTAKGQACRDTMTVLALTCLLGLTWGLAFFSFGAMLETQIFAFTILNSLQGLFIFIWYCAVQTRAGGTSESGPTQITK